MEPHLNYLINYTDKVWCKGEVVRVDYSTTLPEGKDWSEI